MKLEKVLMTKKDIYIHLGYKNMDNIYKKILTENKIKELGFSSLRDFKRIKIFDLEQTRKLRDFLVEVKPSEK